MAKVLGLRCKECGEVYPKNPVHVCELCFGPLEIIYNYDEIASRLTKSKILDGPLSMWRYADLLPIDGDPTVGRQVGYTPLVKADNLAKVLGVRELYVKNDSVNHPTLSFKDRVVAVALSKAREFGFDTVGCASTGNLANSVAAHAAEGKFKAYIFIPHDLEQGKVLGTLVYGATVLAVKGNYDEVNRLCSEVAGKYGWGLANVNLRPFYGDGSKTVAYEIAEQLGWRAPQNIVAPSAGGSLLTKIYKGLQEFHKLGLIPDLPTKMYCAQATGCCPITTMVKERSEIMKPVKPNTIAKSIAIGNPADGYYAADTCRKSGGWAEDVTDDEVIEGIRLLAETEGIFTETAGGVTVSTARKLINQGILARDESIVLCITGNGLKTQEAILGKIGHTIPISPNLASLAEALAGLGGVPETGRK
ncbi:MAG: threonine synthase [Capsulimonadaceae bacterium]|nr:threonine synthase [Capsulimonadaceae bacterium]